ncbi:MAG: nucleotidyltransferase [Lachnospiraceae bacterium]|nr:nucleotidyltransferase [Lachnospiraceae bacterium]
MKKPVLVVMAAGMGSRYGGLKQIDPIDEEGHIIIDFSIYDAVCAGFEKVIFIIKKENEEDFRSTIGNRLSGHLEVAYVYQDLANLPEEFSVPEGRVKPWGTGHAVLSCLGEADGPIAVINADDYYGRNAFTLAYNFLARESDGLSSLEASPSEGKGRYMMVGYRLENTLTENGSVARGVCETDNGGYLKKITERTHIEKRGGEIAWTEDDGATWHPLVADTTVSLNMWGFSADILTHLKEKFYTFLEENLEKNPLKCEYFLPFVVDELLREKKAVVKVEQTPDKWYGVTYKEDKPALMAAIQDMKDEGIYPQRLWE